jgi:hypothetical protein
MNEGRLGHVRSRQAKLRPGDVDADDFEASGEVPRRRHPGAAAEIEYSRAVGEPPRELLDEEPTRVALDLVTPGQVALGDRVVAGLDGLLPWIVHRILPGSVAGDSLLCAPTAHSSSGLGHRPLTAAARVRIPYAPLVLAALTRGPRTGLGQPPSPSICSALAGTPASCRSASGS